MRFSFVLILSTIILWGLWGFFAKLASVRIGIQVSFWTALLVSVTLISYLFVGNNLFPIKKDAAGITYAVLAGLASGLASILFYVLLGKKPAGFLVATTSLYPLVTIVLSVIFLKEGLSVTKTLGFLFALLALFLLGI